MFSWPISLAPGEQTAVSLAKLLRSSVDRAEGEGL
jgi:hypothetical protein